MSGFVCRGIVAITALVVMQPALAHADDPPPRDPSNATKSDDLGNVKPDSGSITFHQTDTIVIRSTPDRSTANVAILSSIAGVGLALGAVGLYYHLDARTNANDVSNGVVPGTPWTAKLQAEYDRSNSSATKATVFYAIGGAAIVGAIVGTLVTAPKEETTVMHPKVGIAPTRGGADIAAVWSF